MNEIVTQVVIFFALVFLGALTRLGFLPLSKLQNKIGNKFFTVITDLTLSLLGAASMMLVCFLLGGEVRIFYALFFIGGIALAHFALQSLASKESTAKKIPAAEPAEKAIKSAKKGLLSLFKKSA